MSFKVNQDGDAEINIKPKDLLSYTSGLMDAVSKLERKNKEKIFKFLVNLIENGGRNQTQAAVDAGFGSDDEAGRNVASVEATRLLADPKIWSIYDEILRLRFLSQNFVKLLQKEHIIMMYYRIAVDCEQKQPKQSLSALREIGLLCGYYGEDENDNEKLKDVLDALISNHSSITSYQSFSDSLEKVDKKTVN